MALKSSRYRGRVLRVMNNRRALSHTTHESTDTSSGPQTSTPRQHMALVVAFSAEGMHRVGEVGMLSTGRSRNRVLLGRGAAHRDDLMPRLSFVHQRPGANRPRPPIEDRKISRRQLEFTITPAGAVEVENVGLRSMTVNGRKVDKASLRSGDVIAIKRRLLLYCERRSPLLPELCGFPSSAYSGFGEPDRFGVVGESPRSWELRDELALAAEQDCHTLLVGESGSGKELAAAAIHGLSKRHPHKMVSRNAATFPASLIDAELFGNMANYPNPGMQARVGLIGAANNTTLFLDEIGELPETLQAHLLRVLDHGEYQRLGEKDRRTSKFVLLAATNRSVSAIKHDLSARLVLRVHLPTLNERRSDIPLILQHLVRRIAATTPKVRARFFERRGDATEPRIEAELVSRLLTHDYTHQVRELETFLRTAIARSRGDTICLVPGLESTLDQPADDHFTSPAELSREDILACLEKHEWQQAATWRDLGLKNRYALRRLIQKHDLKPPSGSDAG